MREASEREGHSANSNGVAVEEQDRLRLERASRGIREGKARVEVGGRPLGVVARW